MISRSNIGDINGSGRWLPVALILIFIVLKIPHLNNPFYWDEAWVYAPAIFDMSQGIPSPFPGHIYIDLSRGHPLLFHFLGGLFLKVFGNKLFFAHVFALSISVLCLTYFYKLSKLLLDTYLAVVAMILLASYEMFFVQSIMVLPEVMLCCWFIASVYYYLKEKPYLFFMSLSALVWTKETGVVFALSFLLLILFKVLNKRNKLSVSNLMAVVGSLMMFALFFLLNKYKYGWFLFPEHTGMIETDLSIISAKLRELYNLIFSYKGQWTLLLPIVPLAYTLIKHKSISFNEVILFISFLGLCLLRNYPKGFISVSICYVAMLISSLILIIKLFKKDQLSINTEITVLLWVSMNAFILFSTLNFLTGRYVLIAYPIVIIIALQIIKFLVKYFESKLLYGLLVPISIVTIVNLLDNKNIADTDLGHIPVMKCQRQIANSLAEVANKNDLVKLDFLLKHHFKNINNGYYFKSFPVLNFTNKDTFDYFIHHDLIHNSDQELYNIKQKHTLKLVDECLLDYYKIQLYSAK